MRDKSGNYLSVVFETSPSQPRNGSSQPPLTTISDSGFFWPKSLSLSLNLTSLPRSNPKSINFSLSTRFSPNPNLCSLFDLGLKRARGRCECLEVLVSDGELLLFFFFFGGWVWVRYASSGDQWGWGRRTKQAWMLKEWWRHSRGWERKREEREFNWNSNLVAEMKRERGRNWNL